MAIIQNGNNVVDEEKMASKSSTKNASIKLNSKDDTVSSFVKTLPDGTKVITTIKKVAVKVSKSPSSNIDKPPGVVAKPKPSLAPQPITPVIKKESKLIDRPSSTDKVEPLNLSSSDLVNVANTSKTTKQPVKKDAPRSLRSSLSSFRSQKNTQPKVNLSSSDEKKIIKDNNTSAEKLKSKTGEIINKHASASKEVKAKLINDSVIDNNNKKTNEQSNSSEQIINNKQNQSQNQNQNQNQNSIDMKSTDKKKSVSEAKEYNEEKKIEIPDSTSIPIPITSSSHSIDQPVANIAIQLQNNSMPQFKQANENVVIYKKPSPDEKCDLCGRSEIPVHTCKFPPDHRCPTKEELMKPSPEEVQKQNLIKEERQQRNAARTARNKVREEYNKKLNQEKLKYVADKYYLCARDKHNRPMFNTAFANTFCICCKPITLPAPHSLTQCKICSSVRFDDVPLLL